MIKKNKDAKHLIKQDGAEFNGDLAATKTLEEFQAEFADYFPHMSESQRNEALASVHAKAVAHAAKINGNGNTGSNAQEAGTAGPLPGPIGGAGADNSGSGSAAAGAAETGTGAGRKATKP